MKLNRKWHQSHRMPKKPTQERRIAWHIKHSKNCSCRKMPTNLLEKIQTNSNILLSLLCLEK